VVINNQIVARSFDTSTLSYSPGGPGDIVVVRFFYTWQMFALADLISQSLSVSNSDLSNFFQASGSIMQSYAPLLYPVPNSTISELYIDPSNGNARVQWSQGAATASA
jgi:hypothetical protein